MNTGKRTILHIGYSKTGTTWFQKRYFPLVKNALFFSHGNINSLLGNIKNPDDVDMVRKKVSNYKGSKRLIISDERLLSSTENMEKSACFYKNVFEDAVVIIFIRNQIKKYGSNYCEYIKNGGVKRFEEYLYKSNGDLKGGEKHQYDRTLKIYSDIFGKENVKVYIYEEFEKNPMAFCKRFTIDNDIEIDNNKIRYRKVNRSISASMLNAKRIANKFTKKQKGFTSESFKKDYIFNIPLWYELTFLIWKFLSLTRSNSEEIVRGEQKKILFEYFKNSNKKLVDEFNLGLIKDYGYPL